MGRVLGLTGRPAPVALQYVVVSFGSDGMPTSVFPTADGMPNGPNVEGVAQSVEQRPFKPWVLGSSPSALNPEPTAGITSPVCPTDRAKYR